jgi:hypothetical protein
LHSLLHAGLARRTNIPITLVTPNFERFGHPKLGSNLGPIAAENRVKPWS